jgi:hypothetical protein
MPRKGDWAKTIIESSNDLNRVKSRAFALRFIAGLHIQLLARDLSAYGRTLEKAAVRLFRVLVSVVPA